MTPSVCLSAPAPRWHCREYDIEHSRHRIRVSVLQCSLHEDTDGNHGAFTLSVHPEHSQQRKWTEFSPTGLGRRKGGAGAER